MVRLIVLIIMATLILAALGNPGRGGQGRGGRGRGKKKPVAMCRYLDNCDFPFLPWCLQVGLISVLLDCAPAPTFALNVNDAKKQDKDIFEFYSPCCYCYIIMFYPVVSLRTSM